MKSLLQFLFSSCSCWVNRVRYWHSVPLYRHKSRGTKDIGRIQVDKAAKSRQAIKHNWLDPQVRTNYAHSLGKHA